MLELFGGQGQECFGSDSQVVPGIRDTPEMFSPEKNKYHFLPKIEFQPNNGHFRDIQYLTIDSWVFIGQFHNTACDLVIMKVTGACQTLNRWIDLLNTP